MLRGAQTTGTVAGSITVPAASRYQFTGRGSIGAPADGVFQFLNNAGTTAGRLIIGANDATANGLSLVLSGGNLRVRLGDDSNYGPAVAASQFTAINGVFDGSSATKLNVGTDGLLNVTAAAGTPGIIASGNGTALTAGGSLVMGFRMSSFLLGIYGGSGVPTISAAQGSLYLRSDGSTTATRLYVNTTGSTTWTNFVTAA